MFSHHEIAPQKSIPVRPSRRRRGVSFCATEMTLLAAWRRRHVVFAGQVAWKHGHIMSIGLVLLGKSTGNPWVFTIKYRDFLSCKISHHPIL